MNLPQAGEIVSYSLEDAVGRIRLDDGTELRFGATALHGITPAIGLRVTVTRTAPHPLGGQKATELSVAERGNSSYQEKAAEFERTMNAEIASTRSHLDDEHRLFAASLEPAPLSEEERSELAQMQARRDADEQASREAHEQAEALRREAKLLLEGRSTSETWMELLKKSGVEPRVLSKLLALARPAAVLVGVLSSSPLTCGASKLGGEPDLPKEVVWPRFKGRPLSFVAQINLSHLPAGVRESLSLRAVGMVSFFYESGQQPWGYDPEDRGAACVIFSPRIDALTSTAPPADLPEDRKYSELEFGVREQTSMPALGTPAVDELELDPDSADAYLAAIRAFESASEETTSHRFGGHAMPIQGAMEEECALVCNGVNVGGEIDRSNAEIAAYAQQAGQWRLLMQLDSDESAGTEWGDFGRLYFWIREDDLHKGEFGKTWCILQCG